MVVNRNWMNPVPHLPTEIGALLKPRFVLGSQSVAVSEPHRGRAVVLVVLTTRDWPIIVIEPRMILPMLIVAIRIVLIPVVAGLSLEILTLYTVLERS